MRVLVTGGAGFIGSHSVESLVSAGHDVLVIDDLSAGRRDNLRGVRSTVELQQVDVRDRDRLRDHFRRWKPDAVLHLAAIVSVVQSVEQPIETASVNLMGSLEVLEAARLAGARRLVAASSASVYGANPRLPCRETDPPAPASPYAAQKLALEDHLGVYQRLYGLETLALRYFNVYGSRQDPHSPYAGVVADLRECIQQRKAFDVHGDGEQTRDFVSVLDVADVNRRLIEAPALESPIANVGTGRETSVLDLVTALSRLLAVDVPLEFVAARPGDVRRSRANIRRLRAALPGLRTRGLRAGLADAFLAERQAAIR
jgi:UDP-glucose 4-epimerase